MHTRRFKWTDIGLHNVQGVIMVTNFNLHPSLYILHTSTNHINVIN